jgi:hypothetical protein
MTIQEKKEAVRQFIVRAVPSVMDLKMGCEVKINGNNTAIYAGNFGKKELLLYKNELHQRGRKPTEDEIIGRPISLADVLVAIGEKNQLNGWTYAVTAEGEIILVEWNDHEVRAQWDLSQDFDHQSEETISFLWSLLCE